MLPEPLPEPEPLPMVELDPVDPVEDPELPLDVVSGELLVLPEPLPIVLEPEDPLVLSEPIDPPELEVPDVSEPLDFEELPEPIELPELEVPDVSEPLDFEEPPEPIEPLVPEDPELPPEAAPPDDCAQAKPALLKRAIRSVNDNFRMIKFSQRVKNPAAANTMPVAMAVKRGIGNEVLHRS